MIVLLRFYFDVEDWGRLGGPRLQFVHAGINTANAVVAKTSRDKLLPGNP
jgi:hypothetical protein